jgi:glucose-1-phosphate adenylyltransferase
MEELSDKTLVLILCGGKGERLHPLTRDRAKPSVPFLGIYRIIDFSLSNCLNSGLRKIGLLTQYKSLSLERHLLNGWSIFHPESRGYIISLPAQGRVGDHWYEGTADAVFQNIYSIQQENPELVLVLSGDHVYRADYRPLLQFQHATSANAVIPAKLLPRLEGRRLGILRTDNDSRIMEFLEKPKNPPGLPGNESFSLASMGIYLFKTATLIRALIQDAKNRQSSHDFGKDVLPRLIRDSRVFAFHFKDYWEDIGTVDAYWKSQMAFLSPVPPFSLRDQSWPIRTFQKQYAPVSINGGTIQNSVIGPGSTIIDATVRNSIISPAVVVSPESSVVDSIVLEGARIGRRAKLVKVIVDKYSIIPENFVIGESEARDRKLFKISPGGVRIVPKNWWLR